MYKVKRFSSRSDIRNIILNNYPTDTYNKINKFAIDLHKESKRIFEDWIDLDDPDDHFFDCVPGVWKCRKKDLLDRAHLWSSDYDFNIDIMSFGDIDEIHPVSLEFNLKSKLYRLHCHNGSVLDMGLTVNYDEIKSALISFLKFRYRRTGIKYEIDQMIRFIKSYRF